MQGTHKEVINFPTAISASQIEEYHKCQTAWYWKYCREQKMKGIALHLHAGGAFAVGLEVARKAYYIRKASQEEATEEGVVALIKAYGDYEPPEKESKKWERMAGALVFYLDRYPFATDILQPWQSQSGPAIEFSFAIPLPINHPQTGEPLLYTGRLDMLGTYGDGAVWPTDEKTTGQLGASWAQQWDLRGQFIGYTWGVLEHGIPANGVFVRGIAIYKEEFKIAETPVLFSKNTIKAWHAQMLKTVEQMIACWQTNWYNQVFGYACFRFAGCDYLPLCKSEDPEIWLPTYYEKYSYSSIRKVEENAS